MLQRAASNAYSWWWASHIRTKQSKWLDNSVHEMEEKVKTMIKLIDEDADTFAKKAEMYFKRRPELINFVEETYKAYRALADRYDRISGELHKANHTIATVFPDHVQLMEDDEDDGTPKAISSIDSSKFPNPPPVSTNLPKPPAEIPPLSARIKSREAQSAPKKPHHKSVTSQISQEKAQEEIDRLQKEILVLQTKKEFFKSSYESGLAKYWDTERQMTELQEEVSQLQDEFSAGGVIEDNEARALMAATALKSCEDTLVSLQEQQKISTEESRIESERIKIAKKMLQALKGEWEIEEISNTNTTAEEVGSLKHERLELQSICQKVKEHFEMSSDASVVELAEKIDELVDKVISLEAIVSSQTAQIQRLRSETDELQKHLRGLEEDKQNLIGDSNDLNQRLIQAEEELSKVQELEKSVKNEKGILQTHFAEACDSLNDLSEKLQSPKGPSQEEMLFSNPEPAEEIHARNVEYNPEKVKSGHKDGDIDQMAKAKSQDEEEDIPDWQQLLLKGIEGKGRMILLEYSSMLQSFKETKKRLTEMEKKNQEDHMETMSQIQELRNVNAVKDDEIRKLRQKLFSHNSLDGRRGTKEGAKNLQRLADLIVNKTDPPLQVADIGSLLIEEQVKLCHLDQPHTASPMVDKFRADIDTLLEENLDFWLRFSTSYHQIQKFQETFKELQSEVEKEMELKNQEGGSGETNSSPTDKKLRDFNTELQVWLEKNALLKGELQCRFTSICSIQEEISKVSKASETENVQFTPYQAAKFQGEVLNMRQENKKVAKELQTGLDHVRGLQVEVGRALSRLRQNFEPSKGNHHNYHHNMRHLSTKTRIPLRTFLFGAKPKKPSIFSCMNPAFHKQYSDMRAAGGRYPA